MRDTLRLDRTRYVFPTVLAALDRASWHARAACRGSEINFTVDLRTERYFPGSPTVVAGMLTCDGCPVRRECLVEALVMGDLGIRGGSTAVERAAALGASEWEPKAPSRREAERIARVLAQTRRERLDSHVAAFREALARAVPKAPSYRSHPTVRRVLELLGERGVVPASGKV